MALAWREGGAGDVCALVLDRLPTWFGIPEANQGYREAAERHPTVVAVLGDEPVGLLTLVGHSPDAAEVHLVAVTPDHHRAGIGRLMLEAAEARLRSQGVSFLQVKTLSASSPDEGYARTRRFYEGMGFKVLEEMPGLWDPSNPAVILIKAL